MPEHATALRRQPEGVEVSFSLPVRHKHKAANQIYERFVLAPLNPLLVYIMVHPDNARPGVSIIVPGVVYLQIDLIKLRTHGALFNPATISSVPAARTFGVHVDPVLEHWLWSCVCPSPLLPRCWMEI